MKILFASDHAGFELKGKLIAFVQGLGYETEDLGPTMFDANDDYPDYIQPLAKRIAAESGVLGVTLGGSGQGEAMVPNRVKGVRAAVFYGGPIEIVKLAREHNDANVLALGARFLSEEEARTAVQLFLETPFSNDERHVRRIKKIDA